MTAERTCSVDDCENAVDRRAMCSAHYSRWKRHGDPLHGGPINQNRSTAVRARPRILAAPCSVEDCANVAQSRGWCGKHYARWLRTGSTDVVRVSPGVGRTEKRCNDCGEVKPISEFYRNEKAKSWSARCRPCHNALTETRRQARRDRDLATKREWYVRNRAKVADTARVKYWDDPEAARAAKRADHAKHRESRNARHYERLQSDPIYRKRHYDAVLRNRQMRRAQKRGSVGMPITRAALDAKIAYWGNRCWCCGGEWSEIDHVKPISKGGWHVLANLRPICSPCNKAKSARWPVDTSTRSGSMAA